MRQYFSKLAAILTLLTLTACSLPHLPKSGPNYTDVSPIAKPLVDEYISLSAQYNLHFKNKVTVGFTDINQGNAIGMCTYGDGWREIDLDRKFWLESSQTAHLALVFHELTHCYCTRDHDYGDGEKYSPTASATNYPVPPKGYIIIEIIRNGYFNDGCPLSLMHPEIVEDQCVLEHYSYYIKEMFNRCDPY